MNVALVYCDSSSADIGLNDCNMGPRSGRHSAYDTPRNQSCNRPLIARLDVPVRSIFSSPTNAILRFAHCFFFFICQLTFFDVCQPTFLKFLKLFHMTWLQPQRKRCYAHFRKVPPNKNEGRKPQISPHFASNRNILSAITRDVGGNKK